MNWLHSYLPRILLHSRHSIEKSYWLTWVHWKKERKGSGKENVSCATISLTSQPCHTDGTARTYLSGLRSSLCARLCARAPLALLLRCSSLFCWMRASSFEMVPIPKMESLIPWGMKRKMCAQVKCTRRDTHTHAQW